MYVFGFMHNFPPALGQKVITEACRNPPKGLLSGGFIGESVFTHMSFDGYRVLWGFPGYAVAKNPPASAGDARDGGSIPGWGRAPGEGNGKLFWDSCLENSVDRGAWRGYSQWGHRVGHD